jgi:hypothetical protein
MKDKQVIFYQYSNPMHVKSNTVSKKVNTSIDRIFPTIMLVRTAVINQLSVKNKVFGE